MQLTVCTAFTKLHGHLLVDKAVDELKFFGRDKVIDTLALAFSGWRVGKGDVVGIVLDTYTLFGHSLKQSNPRELVRKFHSCFF